MEHTAADNTHPLPRLNTIAKTLQKEYTA